MLKLPWLFLGSAGKSQFLEKASFPKIDSRKKNAWKLRNRYFHISGCRSTFISSSLFSMAAWWRWIVLPLRSGRYLSQSHVFEQDGSIASLQLFNLLASFGFALTAASWITGSPATGDKFVILYMITMCILILHLLCRRPQRAVNNHADQGASDLSLTNVHRLIRERLPVIGLISFCIPGFLLDMLYIFYYADCFFDKNKSLTSGGDPVFSPEVTTFTYHLLRVPTTALLMAFCMAFYGNRIPCGSLQARFHLMAMLSIVAVMWFDTMVDNILHELHNRNDSFPTISWTNVTISNSSKSNEPLPCCNGMLRSLTPFFYPLHIEFALLATEIISHIYHDVHSSDEEPGEAREVEDRQSEGDGGGNGIDVSEEEEEDDGEEEEGVQLQDATDLIPRENAQQGRAVHRLKVFIVVLIAVLLNIFLLTLYVIEITSENSEIVSPILFHVFCIVYYLSLIVIMYRAFYHSAIFVPQETPSTLSGLEYTVIFCVGFASVQLWMNLFACCVYINRYKHKEEGNVAAAALHLLWIVLNLCGIYLQTALMLHASRVRPKNVAAMEIMRQTLMACAVFNFTQWAADSFLNVGATIVHIVDPEASDVFERDPWSYAQQITQPFAIFFRFNSFFLLLGAYLECRSRGN